MFKNVESKKVTWYSPSALGFDLALVLDGNCLLLVLIETFDAGSELTDWPDIPTYAD